MPIHLHDVFDAALLDEMLTARYVKRQTHPDTNLVIYNYTQLAQFARQWNPVTLACRGLITDTNGMLVARPFSKFFNLSEHPDETLPDGRVHVTDKLDGSLGILYPLHDGYAVATRGSFASDQARHATNVWTARYAHAFTPNPAWTYLFEIVFPANRVVVDYAGTDDLFLLGAVETATGRSVPLSDARAGWPGPVVEEFPYDTLQDALSAPERPGAEGVVVHFVDADLRVKVKQAEYVRLHRIVTGVSERRIWEALAAGDDLTAWLEAVPDECFAFVTGTRDRLLAEHASLTSQLRARYDGIMQSLPPDATRKEFALKVVEYRDWPLHRGLFSIADGKDTTELVWRQLKPESTAPMWAVSEDSN